MRDVCWGCKQPKTLVHTDPLARRFCAQCLSVVQMGSSEVAARRQLLVTVPFEKGDVVECRTAGERYEGTGTIDVVSMDIKDGATPVIPLFHVNFTVDAARDKGDGWFSEYDLLKVAEVSA